MKYALTLSPIISKLANLSFSTGTFPSIFKKAQVLSLLKKTNLDPTSPANYRPISNLSTMSKLSKLERLFLSRLRLHLTSSSNFSSFQSAYRIDGLAFSWLQYYLSNRTQYVKLGNHSSSPVELLAGVPQGSVQRPLLFTTYTSPPVQHNS